MRRWGVALGVFAVTLAVAPSPAGADYESTAESWACGPPRFYPPAAGSVGSLPDGHRIEGPAGALFGRTIGDVEDRLVWWTVPMSDGARVRVHELLLPALRRVEANLAEAAEAGLHYRVRAEATSSYLARTSRSHDRISYHGLGAAIDVNSDTNPYRLDGVLVTDMPGWFVRAWEEAGFCWGGAWDGVKDPMHFSWEGPASTPGFSSVPLPRPPLTSPRDFVDRVDRRPIALDAGGGDRFVLDMSGDGAPDVAQLRSTTDGEAVLEAATSQRGYLECSVWRWQLGSRPEGEPFLADVAGVGRPDLVFVDDSSSTLSVARYSVMSGYERAGDIDTAVPVGAGKSVVFGDVDRDGADDLFVVGDDGTGIGIEVWSARSGYTEMIDHGTVAGLGLGSDSRLLTADDDGDGRHDLVLLESDGEVSTLTVVGTRDLSTVSDVRPGPAVASSATVGLADHDGDGRYDLALLTGAGVLESWLGNSKLGTGSTSAWFVPDDFECHGAFVDDDGSVFEPDIEWLAAAGITKGCDPPANDRFCPEDPVTRGQMAAFLVRALGLEAASNSFVDDDGSVFESDVGSLAAAGITKGCDPPANDRFCPEDPVTRGQMAAFLRRAEPLIPDP